MAYINKLEKDIKDKEAKIQDLSKKLEKMGEIFAENKGYQNALNRLQSSNRFEKCEDLANSKFQDFARNPFKNPSQIVTLEYLINACVHCPLDLIEKHVSNLKL